MVKRVAPDYPQNATEFEIISLRDGDRVVGAVQLADEAQDLVFVTSDAQLLRFGAASVRPQGRSAAGMAGIGWRRAGVVWFGAIDPVGAEPPGSPRAPVVVTVAGSAGALPGTSAVTVKVTPYGEYPPKGRATGGVRCHRFPEGRGRAGAGLGRARARPRLDRGRQPGRPPPDGRRDGSGIRIRHPLRRPGRIRPG